MGNNSSNVPEKNKDPIINAIKEHKRSAREKAIDNLARYKFMNFGYWAAIWIHLNQIDQDKERSPFRALVDAAREIQKEDSKDLRKSFGRILKKAQ